MKLAKETEDTQKPSNLTHIDKSSPKTQDKTFQENNPLNTPLKPKRIGKRKINKYINKLIDNNFNETKGYQETNGCSYEVANKNAYKTYDKLEPLINDMVKYGSFPISKVTPEYIIGRLTELSNNAKNESVKANCLMLLGRFRALFTDKLETKDTTLTPELESAMDNYKSINRLGDNNQCKI